MADLIVDPLVPVPPVPDPAPIVPPVLVEPELEPPQEPPVKPHPLAPGGERFEQVYAQWRQEQRDREKEHEARIQAEARLAALTTPPMQKKEYSWEELEQLIAQGQITRADAYKHREEVVAQRLSTQIKEDFNRETSEAMREQTLSRGIAEYVQTMPNIAKPGSPERIRADAEFDWLASVHGVNVTTLKPGERKVLELTALRNVFGPIESLSRRTAPPSADPHQGTPGGTPPVRPVNEDQKLIDGLTPVEVTHYQKMMRAGKYPGGWKDVVAELKYAPPAKYNYGVRRT